MCHVSSYECVRARQVALSRAIFLFLSGHVWACSVISCRILSSFFVICRHLSSFVVPKGFFRVWRATGGCSTGWAGRTAVCSAWLQHRAPDVKNDMTLILSWPTVATGPRLRSFMFSTIVLQDRGVCSAWNFQDAFQNGGGLLRCSEGAGCSAVVGTVIHAVDLMETVDGSGSGGVFIHENQVNCGSIVARGDLHPSPPGAVLQQAREPKPAAGETAATPGTRSQKFGMQPAAHPS